MNDVLAGLQVADDAACAEFTRRQASSAHLGELAEAASLLSDVVAAAQLTQPDTLMAFKYPEKFSPVALPVLRGALDAAAAGDRTATVAAVTGLSFDDLATLRSLAARLHHYATRL